jgi:simple sugar transport system ATP-binding protein
MGVPVVLGSMAQTQYLAKPVTSRGDGHDGLTVPSIRLELITKRFGNVIANDSVSCEIDAGHIHAFLGENGAGKSTLMKILCGHYQPDAGLIWVDGQKVTFASPSQARNLGIGMVHQQLTLVPSMTVLENVLLGDADNPFVLRHRAQAERVAAKAAQFGIEIDVLSPIWRLSVAERQKVEILKLLWRNARILILDEPTSQLAPFEAEDILQTVSKLSKQGRIVILISHHIEEILRFSSHITVLRKGRCVGNLESRKVHAQELANLMVDVQMVSAAARTCAPVQFPQLSMKGVCLKSSQHHRSLNAINLDIYSGEVLGIAGVIGSGQDEIASILTGHLEPSTGTLTLEGRPAPFRRLKNPRTSAAYVPADPKMGTVASLTSAENSFLRDVHRKEFLKGPFLKSQLIRQTAQNRITALDVRPDHPDALCGTLSGGNRQRLILARELENPSPILIAVNPTAGLDLAMCQRVRQELKDCASRGKAVVLVSPDLQELLSTCDRIAVMCGGSIVGTEPVENLDAESLGLLLGGVEFAIVRKLTKLLQSDSDLQTDSQIDVETKAALRNLFNSNSGWKRRLAAQIGLRVLSTQDLSEIEMRLADETNEDCRAWLQLILAKLGSSEHLQALEEAFFSNPSVFLEVERRVRKCEDLQSLKRSLSLPRLHKASPAEERFALLVAAHLDANLEGLAEISTVAESMVNLDLQNFAPR